MNSFTKGFATTATLIVGLGISIPFSAWNNTVVVDSGYFASEPIYFDFSKSDFTSSGILKQDNYICQKSEVFMLRNPIFGLMRDASPEEQQSVTDYIMSIATKTGIKFDDIC